MIFAQVRPKSQITLPHKIMVAMGLKEGDILEVSAKENKITLTPKAVIDEVILSPREEKELDEALQQVKEGKVKIFDSMDELIRDLHK